MTKTNLSEFREAVYQEVVWRPAAILDLVDTLTMAGRVSSPVALSESSVFRRKFSSGVDALVQGELGEELKNLFNRSQGPDWETIAGYDVHAVDATPNERMSAETLADRGVLKAQQKEDQPLTPSQVQRSAQTCLWHSGTPAANTRLAGKGSGRQKGYHPPSKKAL